MEIFRPHDDSRPKRWSLAKIQRSSVCCLASGLGIALLIGGSTAQCACNILATQTVTTADCSSMNLAEIPKCLPADTSILDLLNNNISSLTNSSLSLFSNLRSLNLGRNSLVYIDEETFTEHTSLHVLFLNGNQITSLPEDVFSPLRVLHALSLADNRLRDLPAGIFNSLMQAQEIYLNDNMLTSLPVGIFSSATRLKRLDLHNNQLTFLAGGTFSEQRRLTVLLLHGNPWLCVGCLCPLVLNLQALRQSLPASDSILCSETSASLNGSLMLDIPCQLNCQTPSLQLENAAISKSSSRSPVVNVVCFHGYHITGSPFSMTTVALPCTIDGIISQSLACKAVDCGVAPLGRNTVRLQNGSTANSSVIDRCLSPDRFVQESGDFRRICESNGQFSGSVLHCLEPGEKDDSFGDDASDVVLLVLLVVFCLVLTAIVLFAIKRRIDHRRIAAVAATAPTMLNSYVLRNSLQADDLSQSTSSVTFPTSPKQGNGQLKKETTQEEPDPPNITTFIEEVMV